MPFSEFSTEVQDPWVTVEKAGGEKVDGNYQEYTKSVSSISSVIDIIAKRCGMTVQHKKVDINGNPGVQFIVRGSELDEKKSSIVAKIARLHLNDQIKEKIPSIHFLPDGNDSTAINVELRGLLKIEDSLYKKMTNKASKIPLPNLARSSVQPSR